VHISEAELARDIAAVLDRVQSGIEIVIERNAQPGRSVAAG
jgi:antitoxin (DNA-binding transcriptional repressor) of toxin-antitoxin stability system